MKTANKPYCSNHDKCGEGEGICNAHTDCEGELKVKNLEKMLQLLRLLHSTINIYY